jgi:uncharacterized protein (TIGR02145 family)
MKKIIFLLLVFSVITNLNAQNYLISFTGTGASAIVDSVKVENITQCKDTVISGSYILGLTGTVGIKKEYQILNNSLRIYPSPSNANCLIEFESTYDGTTTMELYDITGRRIIKDKRILPEGFHTFNITGINSGIFFLKINSNSYSHTAKIVNFNTNSGTAKIFYLGKDINNFNNNYRPNTKSSKDNKDDKVTVYMQYSTGDRLKFTGYSGGIYRTIFMLVPTFSQTVNFNFVSCTDANGNHYAVVQIGMQLWMAENLKATKYRNGTNIPNVPDSVGWANATTGAYCDYRNNTAEGLIYGHLYNFYAGDDVQNIAPLDWHVSTNNEWTVLSNFLGGDSISGQKMKENCDTRWAYFDTAWGTNTYGFTALCTNFRNATGAWSLAPNHDHDCFFWTSTTGINPTVGHANSLRWCYRDLWRTPGVIPKRMGASLRCVHD